MPSEYLLLYFCHPLKISGQWAVNGVHYSKTLEVWLRRMDKNVSCEAGCLTHRPRGLSPKSHLLPLHPHTSALAQTQAAIDFTRAILPRGVSCVW
jgi:hypothetical protein